MAKAQQKNSVRIIAGKWKGRRIEFVDVQGLRPTKDFIRETLFNWLAGDIVGSRCLDLFAGSGALSFEAVSRGADEVIAVDSNINVSSCLQRQSEKINVESLYVFNQKAEQFLLAYDGKPFDIIFLDPPFDMDIATGILNVLFSENILKRGGKIYFEQAHKNDKNSNHAELATCVLLKEKVSGQVAYRLYQY